MWFPFSMPNKKKESQGINPWDFLFFIGVTQLPMLPHRAGET